MEFEERLSVLAAKIRNQRDAIQTEMGAPLFVALTISFIGAVVSVFASCLARGGTRRSHI
ncbi:hypothetical protein [Brevibacterium sp. RIT 803]|uniref:hypothetical protein n=1 Tax=Brevibacterium sp. RIT 803 TaxID=2810210 RepID=UPI001951F8A5|nr:hypothetical protein [Brevibacterium sp. RIT 803]MBM6590820.1 hypothetical protein [Brevibacterium sp. RIT 803]